jgi:hypothetical protein
MRSIFKNVLLPASALVLLGCEDNIDVTLPQSEPVVVIDAWINNKAETQTIKVQRSIPYFENSFLPGISNASVQVVDLTDDITYNFEPGQIDGHYEWQPGGSSPAFGKIGNDYKLVVQVGSDIYESFASMNRVPDVDSISYRFEKGNAFFPDSYFAGVYARDFEGLGDAYWIKAWKNGQYLNKPDEITISYDAGGSPGASVDGIPFIQPVRDGINPFDTDENDEFLPPYEPGDSVYVEIHSIEYDSYLFLNEVIVQTDRPGGFGELFAQPLANVPTNILISTESPNATIAIGFFTVSAVSSGGRRLDPNNLPPSN